MRYGKYNTEHYHNKISYVCGLHYLNKVYSYESRCLLVESRGVQPRLVTKIKGRGGSYVDACRVSPRRGKEVAADEEQRGTVTVNSADPSPFYRPPALANRFPASICTHKRSSLPLFVTSAEFLMR